MKIAINYLVKLFSKIRMTKNQLASFLGVFFIVGVAKILDYEIGTEFLGIAFIGDLITTNRREREDLSSVIDILALKDDDMKYLSFINFLPSIEKAFNKKVTAQKHEWLDDTARSEYITVTASGDAADWDTTGDKTALPITAPDRLKLRIGDVLLTDEDEIMIVSALAALSIDVYTRGHGSSTAVVLDHNSSHVCKIIGNAQIENGDPIAANFTAQTAGLNYTQIFEDVAQISGTLRRSKMANGDELDYQVVKKLKELLKSLNYTMLEGVVDLDATNFIGTMGGLREFITITSNVGGALSVAKIYTAVTAHIDGGLYPSAIHGSPESIGDIEQLYQGAVRTKVSDKKGGTEINTIVVLGYEIELHVDKHMRSDEALILDYNRVGYGPLDGGVKGQSGAFATYPVYDKTNGKQLAIQVLGEYTMRVSNGGGTRMYGIT